MHLSSNSLCLLLFNLKRKKEKELTDLEKEKELKQAEKFWPGEERKRENGLRYKIIMLPQKYRLTKNKEFESVFKKGKGYKEQFLSLKLTDNDFDFSRFAFIVSNKISKKSTVRHKIKRRIREIIRLRINKIKNRKDVILIAQIGITDRGYREIEEVVDKLLKKAKLFKR